MYLQRVKVISGFVFAGYVAHRDRGTSPVAENDRRSVIIKLSPDSGPLNSERDTVWLPRAGHTLTQF